MTQLFGQTLRDAPAEAQVASHQLLLRAGFIRQLAAGIFSYLPLARRAITKIENIIREEMNAIGGQEITMPVVNPADIWKETGRWYQIGSEMGRFKDKSDRDMVLAMTHEEVVADLVRQEIRSYSQLPRLIYHIQTKWRDDPRPRAGLIRVREFTMKDSYSLDVDMEGLDKQYRAHYQAYFNIYRRCGLDVIAVGSDTGMMGGTLAHEYMALTPIGEDTLMLCDGAAARGCGYAANRQVARFQKPPAPEEVSFAIEKVATPNVTTIADLAAFLDIPAAKTAKAVFMMAEMANERISEPANQQISKPHNSQPTTHNPQPSEQFIFAVIRGDMEVNETKLANAVKAKALRPATEAEIHAVGAEPGYGSPLGVKGALVVVDDAVVASPNLVAGANEVGFHLRNVNYGRDYTADIVTDIAAAQEGDACPVCGGALRAERGVEVGNIFKLGTRYTEAMGARFLDQDGELKPVVMGSYGIGIGRLLACVAEMHHDDYGLIWPITVAPYPVHLLTLGPADSEATAVAERLYAELQAAGIDVLFDDRDRSPGVKFNDADLIGLPLRVTVAARGLQQQSVELKRRDQKERELIPLADIIPVLRARIAELEAEIAKTVVEVPFRES
ncbi:MAG TPA: proline--tRNA ligase [Anaerolineae bacterium]|nr:proline--tRNA ligase [Anaerolineae bacterium]HQI85693.1 proline--tRNA ligase [Anaerolineae bacterium]